LDTAAPKNVPARLIQRGFRSVLLTLHFDLFPDYFACVELILYSSSAPGSARSFRTSSIRSTPGLRPHEPTYSYRAEYLRITSASCSFFLATIISEQVCG